MVNQVGATILAIIALVISAFSMGYSMANWHFSSTYVREKLEKQMEEELRWRCQFNNETARETTESRNDAMDK